MLSIETTCVSYDHGTNQSGSCSVGAILLLGSVADSLEAR
jgi:hypothetical protein